MSKSSGLGAAFFIDGVDLSGDVGAVNSIRGGPSSLDVTGIDKSAHERIGGLRDGGIDFTTYFNDASGQEFQTLKTLPLTNRIVTYCHRTTLGAPAACCVAKQVNYDPTRADDGGLTAAIQTQANGFGVEWGILGTAGKETDASAANGSSIDHGASTSFGLQAYLHVFSLGSGTLRVKIQESSDNGAGDAFADVVGGTFTDVTAAPASERIQTSRTLTVERYLRVISNQTFTDAVFAVVIVRNETAVAF
jgi:hypothetical protein